MNFFLFLSPEIPSDFIRFVALRYLQTTSPWAIDCWTKIARSCTHPPFPLRSFILVVYWQRIVLHWWGSPRKQKWEIRSKVAACGRRAEGNVCPLWLMRLLHFLKWSFKNVNKEFPVSSVRPHHLWTSPVHRDALQPHSTSTFHIPA